MLQRIINTFLLLFFYLGVHPKIHSYLLSNIGNAITKVYIQAFFFTTVLCNPSINFWVHLILHPILDQGYIFPALFPKVKLASPVQSSYSWYQTQSSHSAFFIVFIKCPVIFLLRVRRFCLTKDLYRLQKDNLFNPRFFCVWNQFLLLHLRS